MRPRFRALVVLLMLVPLTVVSTPPEEPPYYGYSLTAQLMRTSAASPERFPIALAARCYGEWRLVYAGSGGSGCAYVFRDKGETTPLTDPRGLARFTVYTQTLLDTMALAIVLPDTIVLGAPFVRAEATADYPIYEDRWREDEGYLCSDSIDLESELVGKEYIFPPDTLVVE
jgi:hypothetical protein